MPNDPVPTAPGKLPVLGHALQLHRRPLAFMSSLSGLGDVVRIHLGTLPVYVPTTPELVRDVLLADSRQFDKGRLLDKMRPLLGDGLLSSRGDFHRTQRRLVQPAFHRDRIAQYAETMRKAAERTADSWKPGQPLVIDRQMTELTLTVVAHTLFSAQPDSAIAAEIHQALPIVLRGSITRSLSPQWLLSLPLPANRRFERAAARLRTAIDDTLRAHRASGVDHGDVLSMLLLARDDSGEGMSDQQVRDEVVTIMLAGVETTQAALVATFHLLGAHPDVEQRLHDELDAVLADKPVTFEDLPRLRYTSRVLTETLRMYPFWFLMRRALRPTTLGSIQLPTGTEIIYSPYMLHHNPRWFPDPTRFEPDRWIPERAQNLPRGAFIPFGAGSRKCVGDTFAMTEATIALATIASRWILRPTPGHLAREVATGPVHLEHLVMTPRRRNQSSHQLRPALPISHQQCEPSREARAADTTTFD